MFSLPWASKGHASKPGQSSAAENHATACAKKRDRGRGLVTEARELEARGHAAAALTKYEAGLDLLLAALKLETDAAAKPALTADIEAHMSRAENLKKRLATSKRRGVGGVVLPPDHYDYTKDTRVRGAPPRDLAASAGAPPPQRAAPPSRRGAGGPAAPAVSPAAGPAPAPAAASATGDAYSASLEARLVSEVLVDASQTPQVSWDAIAGLDSAKRTLQEAVVLPYVRPDLYRGLRAPPRGVLLYGPPGTGKTLLAKAVASESGLAFFSASASALTSKWVGEGEKLVRALFAVARRAAPSAVFLDELDSLLGKREGAGGDSSDATRRLTTEFLVQLDGAGPVAPRKDAGDRRRDDDAAQNHTQNGEGSASSSDEAPRVLFLGATNLPWLLDDAVLRRLPRRVLIPLPDKAARRAMFDLLLDRGGRDAVAHALSKRDKDTLAAKTEAYSMSDLRTLAEEAALEPLRALGDRIRDVKRDDVRPVALRDFELALRKIKPAANPELLRKYDDWTAAFGTRGA